MRISVPDEFLIILLDALQPCANALEINGPAFYMLAQELVELDMDIEDITLGQIAAAYVRSGERYKTMHKRIAGIVEVINAP